MLGSHRIRPGAASQVAAHPMARWTSGNERHTGRLATALAPSAPGRQGVYTPGSQWADRRATPTGSQFHSRSGPH
jgi:hypothetical protein